MTQFNLLFDQQIRMLESNNQWISAAKLLYSLWKENPTDLNNILCAGTQAWFGILTLDFDRLNPVSSMPRHNYEDDVLYEMLMDITRWGEEYHKSNAVFNAYFGYMIYTMPYYFLDYAGDYTGWQVKGIEMTQHAYEIENENPFVRAMFFGINGDSNSSLFNDACKEIWREISPEQWGNSAVQKYFFHILRGDSEQD